MSQEVKQKIIFHISDEDREILSEAGIDLEGVIKSAAADVELSYGTEGYTGEKGIELIILASGVALTMVLYAVANVIRTIKDGPIIVTVPEEIDKNGTPRKYKTYMYDIKNPDYISKIEAKLGGAIISISSESRHMGSDDE